MEYPYLKNIPHEEIITLSSLISVLPGQIVSKTLAQNQAVSVTLFAFDSGEEISTHDSDGDAMVTILDGTGKFIVDGKEYVLKSGETLIMPAKKPHSVHAETKFKMMLLVIFPINK